MCRFRLFFCACFGCIALFSWSEDAVQDGMKFKFNCDVYVRGDFDRSKQVSQADMYTGVPFDGGLAYARTSFGFSSSSFDMVFKPRVSVDGNAAASVDALFVRYKPFEFLTLRAGRFSPEVGSSLAFPCIDWFRPLTTPQDMIDGTRFSSSSDTLFEVTVASHGLSLGFAFSPFMPLYDRTPYGSSLFPMKDIRSQYTDLLGNKSPLDSAAWMSGNTDPFNWVPSYGIDASFRARKLTCTGYYFDGIDRSPAIVRRTRYLMGFSNAYALEMDYAVSRLRSFGLSLKSSLGPATVWLDGDYTQGRLYPVEGLYDHFGERTWQSVKAVSTISWTSGCKLNVVDRFVSASAEWKYTYYPDTSDLISQRFLAQAVYGMLDITLAPVRSVFEVSCAYVLQDGSYLLSYSLETTSRELKSVRLGVSFPSTAPDTDFGQFAGYGKAFVSCAVRY